MAESKQEHPELSRIGHWRLRLEEILTPAEEGDLWSRAADLFLMALILSDLVLVLLEDSQKIRSDDPALHFGLSAILGVFVVEYGLRLWASGADSRYAGFKGLRRFVMTPLMLIDLVSILPALRWLPLMGEAPLEQLVLLRLFRLLRLIRYFEPVMVVLVRTVLRVQRELGVIFVGMLLVVVCSSALMHKLEPENFASTGEAMWWSVVTLTTVGYGDVVPATLWGRLLGASLMFGGLAMFALPAGLLGAAFTREIALHQERRQINRERRRERRRGEAQKRKEDEEQAQEKASLLCPHCGKSFGAHSMISPPS